MKQMLVVVHRKTLLLWCRKEQNNCLGTRRPTTLDAIPHLLHSAVLEYRDQHFGNKMAKKKEDQV